MWGDPIKEGLQRLGRCIAKHPSTYDQTKWIEKYGKVPGQDGVSMFDAPISEYEIEKLDYNVITKYIDSLTKKYQSS